MTQTPNIEHEMPKAYEPGNVEQKWYRFWLDKGYFKPKIDPDKKPFVIIMPPPNVTGELHLGHALTATMEDILTRWHRMKGEPTLWLPGVDHAGIAAQVVVEKVLAAEGIDRHEIGRDKFLERMWQWADSCRGAISKQHQRLGISCDWDREVFTLDKGPSRAVRTAFVRLYERGLIYRGERIINWCPRCATAISDLEVEHKDIGGHLYYVRYPLADNDKEFITVATTRPETILGDTAVAVNPKDKRFKGMVGKNVILPAVKRVIPIISDEAVDPKFGTGAVKITPSHDPVDFEVAQRHDLPLINILNDDATMNENAGPYAGLDRFACRKAIIEDLEKDGLFIKTEPHSHAVGHCIRCQTMIEPVASQQWFVKAEPLARPAIEAVNDGRITIVPQRFTKVYLNWMENIRDWCISRQLWWGHRIPVWYCQDCDELAVSVDDPASCPKCGSTKLEQDPDVLDTWFSSALWTHSTLGWPDETEDLRYFYPTSVMETGYDILFFWVARMIMMGIANCDDIPFHTIFLHGLIRDEKGEKMSKVRGNVLNPIDTLEQYGTDALRFALSTGTAPGNDIKLASSRLEAGRNFANKLWNATRFVVRSISSQEKFTAEEVLDRMRPSQQRPLEDRWILSRLNRTVASVTSLIGEFQLGEALRQIHDFLWGEYCDWYIEFAKIRLRPDSGLPSPLPVLVHVLETSLRLLHPYMPFVTEELWQNLKRSLPANQTEAESVMIAAYPKTEKAAIDREAERVMDTMIDIVRSIRNARAHHGVESSRWVEVQIFADKLTPAINPYTETIQTLARARPITFLKQRNEGASREESLVSVLKEAEVIIPMSSMFDLEAEKGRLQKEIDQSQAEMDHLKARLDNQEFLAKAPKIVIDKERQKLYTITDRLERLREQIGKL